MTANAEKQPLFYEDEGPVIPGASETQFKQDFKEFSLETDVSDIGRPCRPRVSGGCVCKLFIILYLLLCVGLSVLYVGLRYTHETEPEDEPLPWIPGTPTISHPPPAPPVHHPSFNDLPYTEWIPKRWTYTNQPFADWPSLPTYITNITQVAHGYIGNTQGCWLLTHNGLFFASNFKGEVDFWNVSEMIGLSVTTGSMVSVATSKEVYLVTPINITLLDCSGNSEDYCEVVTANTSPLPSFTTILSTAISLSTNTLWLGTDTGLYQATTLRPTPLYITDEQFYDGDIVVTNVSKVKGQVNTLLWRSALSVDGDNYGAFVIIPREVNKHQNIMMSYSTTTNLVNEMDESVQDVFGVLVVGTNEKLYFYDGKNWWFEWISVWNQSLGGIVDGSPTAMTVGSSGEIYISNNISLTRLNTDYTFDRIGPLQGLPYNQLNTLCFLNYNILNPHPAKQYTHRSMAGLMWIGTDKGYILYDLQSSKFKGYFYGPRWHSGERIQAIANVGSSGVVMVTDAGLTFVTPEKWTLAKKAEHYQRMLARHTRKPGLVADCPLTDYNASTCAPTTTDNDGLWTSWLVASEALRYSVTHNNTARVNAVGMFRGLAFLNNVTGVYGLMARSVLHQNSSVPNGEWHDSTTCPGWQWKGDTSSDEVAGHMFAYPLIADLVEDEKPAAIELVDTIVGYIKSNDYHLIDITNQSTRWGVWTPSQLNYNISWADEHGLNSLQILSYLLSAYRLTGKTEYWDAWKELAESPDNHYGLNMINQKITFPRDDNFSDDELAFLPYFTYCQALKMMNNPMDPQVGCYVNLSLARTWRVVGNERSSAWIAIYSYCTGTPHDPALLEGLVETLRNWPLELIQWRTTNSHRLDLRHNPEQDRDLHSNSQSVRLLPANERGQLRWNANPYELDTSGSSNEMDPGPWLLPYWLARWTKML